MKHGIYRIGARHSGKVLDVANRLPVPGIPVIQWDWNGGDNQRWEVVPLEDGSHHIVVQMPLRQMLAVPNGSKSPGHHLVQWPNTNGPEQKWWIHDAGEGFHKVTNVRRS